MGVQLFLDTSIETINLNEDVYVADFKVVPHMQFSQKETTEVKPGSPEEVVSPSYQGIVVRYWEGGNV